MQLQTYGELKAKIERELDLAEETFITSDELLGYFNEAVSSVEALIHTIYEDYFKTITTITLVSGTQAYDLPDDIYAQKIRNLFYNDGSQLYEIYEVKDQNSVQGLNANDPLRFELINSTAAGQQLYFWPTPIVNGSYVTLRYLREAARFTGDDDEVCDIPEFSHVVVQYAKWRCMEKEGHPDVNEAANALDQLKSLMVETLTSRVPNEDNKIRNDLAFYQDFDNWWFPGGNY